MRHCLLKKGNDFKTSIKGLLFAIMMHHSFLSGDLVVGTDFLIYLSDRWMKTDFIKLAIYISACKYNEPDRE